MSERMVFVELKNGGYRIIHDGYMADYNSEGKITSCVGDSEKARPPKDLVIYKNGTEKNVNETTLKVGIEVDISEAQKALDELSDYVRSSEAFKVLNGEVFIKPAFIPDAKIRNAIESSRPVTNTWNINIGKLSDSESYQNTVTFTADRFHIHSGVELNVESIMENALANHEEAERLSDTVRDIVRAVIRKESRPGGLLRR